MPTSLEIICSCLISDRFKSTGDFYGPRVLFQQQPCERRKGMPEENGPLLSFYPFHHELFHCKMFKAAS